MKKVASKDELKVAFHRTFSKTFLRTSLKLPQTYDLENLYIIEDGDFLVLLEDRGTFYLGDIVFNGEKEIFLFQKNELPKKPVVVEYAFKKQHPVIIKTLTQNGFISIANRRQYAIDVEKNTPIVPGEFLNLDHLAELSIKLKEYFDPYYGCIPTKKELAKKLKEGEVLGVIDDDTLAGFLEFKRERASLDIAHIAINPRFRGRAYGKKLINMLKSLCLKEDKAQIKCFVNENNDAIHFYKKLGASPTANATKIYKR